MNFNILNLQLYLLFNADYENDKKKLQKMILDTVKSFWTFFFNCKNVQKVLTVSRNIFWNFSLSFSESA